MLANGTLLWLATLGWPVTSTAGFRVFRVSMGHRWRSCEVGTGVAGNHRFWLRAARPDPRPLDYGQRQPAGTLVRRLSEELPNGATEQHLSARVSIWPPRRRNNGRSQPKRVRRDER